MEIRSAKDYAQKAFAIAASGLRLKHSLARLNAIAAWHDYETAGGMYSSASDFYLYAAQDAERAVQRLEKIAKVCGVAL